MKENISAVPQMSRDTYLEKLGDLKWGFSRGKISKAGYKGLMQELRDQYEGKRTLRELGLD